MVTDDAVRLCLLCETRMEPDVLPDHALLDHVQRQHPDNVVQFLALPDGSAVVRPEPTEGSEQ
jgi:hypothetical protein